MSRDGGETWANFRDLETDPGRAFTNPGCTFTRWGAVINYWTCPYKTTDDPGRMDVSRIDLRIAVVEPVLRDGGFIPGCDHGVPSDISWPNFCEYTRLLAELTGWL